jgi:hypothetical protein
VRFSKEIGLVNLEGETLGTLGIWWVRGGGEETPLPWDGGSFLPPPPCTRCGGPYEWSWCGDVVRKKIEDKEGFHR